MTRTENRWTLRSEREGTQNLNSVASRQKRSVVFLALAIGLVLIAAACTTSEGEVPTTSPPTTVAAAATTTSTTTQPASPTTTEPVVTPAEAIAVANAWYVAFNAGDVDAAMGLFTTDATVGSNFAGSGPLEDERAINVWNAAQGTRLTTEGCTADGGNAPTQTVRCKGATHDALVQAVGAPPVPASIAMTVGPEGISELSYTYGSPDFNNVGSPFENWMRANNPEDARKASFGTWTTTEEANEFGLLRARYAEEWATYLTTNGCIFRNGCILLNERTPGETVEAYVAAYNAHDIDAVMAFFTEESVVTGHPFSEKASGISEIRQLMLTDLSAAAANNAYTISDVEVTGDTVTWNHVWMNTSGQDFCQQGQRAAIEDGTILSWTWPAGDFSCP